MKKILVIHNSYKNTGGEDIAVENEILFLKKYFEVETLFFSNIEGKSFNLIKSLIFSNNKKSNKLLSEKIKDFQPDIAYVHNTWFVASLGIFNILKNEKIKTYVKLHNFRYFCTRSFFSINHYEGKQMCEACGGRNNKFRILNKYYDDSFFKSIAISLYGSKFFRLLKNHDMKILVLTQFHKNFLKDLGISEEKIYVYPNFINIPVDNQNRNESYIVYAGRISEEKGIKELINVFSSMGNLNLKLKIIGEGPLLDEIVHNNQNKEIEIIGVLDNRKVLDIISKSSGVVITTKMFEGQPTLLCEASALGVPSIFPETGGISEFFPDNYPLAYEQFNYEELEGQIKKLNDLDFVKNVGNSNKDYIKNLLNEEQLYEDLKKILS